MTAVAPSQPTRQNTAQPVALAALAILLIGVAAYLFLSHANLGAWDFRNNLWAPAHLLVSGRSPYAIETLFPGSNAVWMPTVIGAFFPLGWLAESQATALWVVISAGAYLALIILSSGKERPAPLTLGISMGVLLIFPPFISAMQLGQFGVIAALLMLIAGRLIVRGASPIWIGLLIALASAKPQLILLPVLGLLWYTWRTQGAARAAQTLLASALWAMLLTLPLWLGAPNWLEGFREAQARRGIWSQPSAFVLLPLHMGDIGHVLWLGLSLVVTAISLRVWRVLSPQRALAWSLALNLLVTPYVWSWDFVLLVPLFVGVFFEIHGRLLRIGLLLGYMAIWYGMVAQRLTTSNDDALYWWLPWAMIALITLMSLLNRRVSQPTS